MVFINLCILVLMTKVASALEGSNQNPFQMLSLFNYGSDANLNILMADPFLRGGGGGTRNNKQGSTFPGIQGHMPLDFAVCP